MTAKDLPIGTGVCPVCVARDAFIDTLRDGAEYAEYYVECVNCGVYRASRRAFRLFQYLREKADTDSLRRLGRLAASLRSLERGATPILDYDTWEELVGNRN